jgi:hypothetical protein
MTEQLSLDWTPAHQKHSPTSKAAAEAIKPKIGPMHALILRLLRDGFGMTDEEMQWGLDMAANTQRPRRRELQNMKLIENSGTTRPTKSGRQQPEPSMGRVVHGLPDRVERIDALGNAVVPIIPEIIGRAILKAEGLTAPAVRPEGAPQQSLRTMCRGPE